MQVADDDTSYNGPGRQEASGTFFSSGTVFGRVEGSGSHFTSHRVAVNHQVAVAHDRLQDVVTDNLKLLFLNQKLMEFVNSASDKIKIHESALEE